MCNLKSNDNPSFCSACQQGKSHKLPFSNSNSNSQSNKPLEIIHSDLWGPGPINSKQGYKYYILFLDGFSRFSCIYPLKQKSDALTMFIHFKTMAEKQFNISIKNPSQ